MENTLPAVRQLVEDFEAQKSYYLSPDYQELQVRQHFIDKFFAALGWDVTHHVVQTFTYGKKDKLTTISLLRTDYSDVLQKRWEDSKDRKVILNANTLALLAKIKNQTDLSFGDVTAMKRCVLFDKTLLTDRKTSENSYKYFEGDVYRHQLNLRLTNWVEFDDRMSERPKELCGLKADAYPPPLNNEGRW